MEVSKAVQILEAIASGCSPSTGEIIPDENILNDRDVIRALQIAIDHLKFPKSSVLGIVNIRQMDIDEAIYLFRDQRKGVSSNNLASFFLRTRSFKNPKIISHKLYGKYNGIYTPGQLIDFFTEYLSKNGFFPGNILKEPPPYRQVDFFQKEKFNRLAPAAVEQLKEKIEELGVLKIENLADYVQEARKEHKRAYEKWSEKEIGLLKKAIEYTNDLDLLSECFQRGRASIEGTGQKIIWEANGGGDKI